MINASLSSALRPLQQQLAKLAGTASEPASALSSKVQDIKQKQKRLEIKLVASTLNLTRGQSQYRCLATINMKLSNAVEAFDEFLIANHSPDYEAYSTLSLIKELVSSAAKDAQERILLILFTIFMNSHKINF